MLKNKNLNNFKKKIFNKQSKISIMGLGYVGLPLALSFAKSGYNVHGYDIDRFKIHSIKKSKSYISSVSNYYLAKYKKKFKSSSNINHVENSDIIIICVPTPINEKKLPILSHVKEVMHKLSTIKVKHKLIIFECTSYPGTTEEYFLPFIKKKKLRIGSNIFLGYSPEREDPGNKKFSLEKKNIPKIVSGYTADCLSLTKLLYSKISKTIPVENIKTAEFTKLLENIYRTVNIGLINELKKVSDKMNINIFNAVNAAKTKPFGYQPFYPGPGVGGHCIPVDPFFLTWKAKKLGIDTKFIKLSGQINDQRPKLIIKKINRFFTKNNKFEKLNCLIVGVAYKKDCDDLRLSPALKIIDILQKTKRFKIDILDDKISIKAKSNFNKISFISKKKLNKKTLSKYDFCLIVTDHSNVNYEIIRKHSKMIFDTRNVYKRKYRNVNLI